jgi:glyoxylase-like metal-dependent hydrolase (beta-lactamase superfamily II)
VQIRTNVANGMPEITGFHEPRTGSVQYVVADPSTRHCAIIDPVLDYDEKSGSIATRSADAILAHCRRDGLIPVWILDTHPHADHLSAADYLRRRTGAQTAIGAPITEVQKLWRRIYALGRDFATDGSQWDRLFEDGDSFEIGALRARVMASPGHTLCSVSYLIGDAAFIHDTLFMPDCGTARTDFPGGDAAQLWRSIQAILSLPPGTRLFTGHDYPGPDRAAHWESSVASQIDGNAHLRVAGEAGFVAMRRARDRLLPMPALILHALQVNLCAGRLPDADHEGRRFLKIPLDALGTPPWNVTTNN